MRLAKILATAAMVSMTAAPAMAADASKLSVAQTKSVRASTSSKDGNKAIAGAGVIVGIVAVAAIIGGIIIASDDGDDSDSN
jgi:uncharacterized oligopeptide transporter (OPT) family protein